MNIPTETPRTDAKAVSHIGFYSCATVPADFARELERELAEVKQWLNEYANAWQAEAGKFIPRPSAYLNGPRWKDRRRPNT